MFQLLIATILTTANIRVNQSVTASRSTQIRQETKSRVTENRCDRVTQAVADYRDKLEATKDRRVNIHHGVISRIRNLLAKLNDQGCDPSAVTADLATWETMITDYRSEFTKFLDGVHSIRLAVCQEEPGDHQARLREARQQRLTAVSQRTDITQFYHNTLKPHLRELKTSCRNATN